MNEQIKKKKNKYQFIEALDNCMQRKTAINRLEGKNKLVTNGYWVYYLQTCNSNKFNINILIST